MYLERALYNCYECRKSFYYYQQGFLTPTDYSSGLGDSSKLLTESDRLVHSQLPLAQDIVGEFSDCREVVFSYRLMRMLDATSNALRQQIMNDEGILPLMNLN